MVVKPAAMSIPGVAATLPAPPQEFDVPQEAEPPLENNTEALRAFQDRPVPEGVTPRREWPGPDTYGKHEGAGSVYEGEEPLLPEALFPDARGVVEHKYVHVVHHVTETVERLAATHLANRYGIPSDHPVQILGRDEHRRRCTILNLSASAATISVGKDGNITAAGNTTFPLAPGASLDIRDRDEWWAIAEAAGVTTLAITVTRDEGSAGPTAVHDTAGP
jgi:hypothetical protein